MNLIELEQKHAPLIVDLVCRTMGPEVCEHCKKALEGPIDPGRRKLYGLLDGDRLLSVCGYYKGFYSDKRLFISWFAVDPMLQRRGVGAEMINHIERTVKESGVRWLYVETYDNETFRKANNFYRKCGYRHAGHLKNYLDDGSDALYYMKDLCAED